METMTLRERFVERIVFYYQLIASTAISRQ